jgi:hypothetical protein
MPPNSLRLVGGCITRLALVVNTNPKLLDIYGTLNALPSLNAPTEPESNQAIGPVSKPVNDSKVVSDNPSDLRTFQDVKTESEHCVPVGVPQTSPRMACRAGCLVCFNRPVCC